MLATAAVSRINPSPQAAAHPDFFSQNNSIQIPMLGPLSNLQPNNQQQQQQQQQQGQPGQQQTQGNIPPPPPQNGQDFTLSSVLHFLQTEWRRYERDRNEWEIERAEMRARIALLEGERRSFENVKLDLMRRIKMLEYALRMERSKQLIQPTAQPAPGSKLASIQAGASNSTPKDEAGSQKEDSSGSSPRSEDSPLPPESRLSNGNAALVTRPNSWANGNTNQMSAGKPPPGRDPKSRARSRDYLKQCLQEISYLTSPQAMNPLPNRPLLNNPSLPLALPNVPPFDQMQYMGRPRKVMPDNNKDFPLLNNIMSGSQTTQSQLSAGQGSTFDRNSPMPSGMLQHPQMQQQHPSQGLHAQQQMHQSAHLASLQSQQQQQAQQQQQHHTAQMEREKEGGMGEMDSRYNSMFRPDEDWAVGKLGQPHHIQPFGDRVGMGGQNGMGQWARAEDGDLKDEEPDIDDDDANSVGESESGKVWKAKRTLRNHLDAVRALAFHPTEMCVVTGGDDCTVKIWRMDVAGLASSSTRPSTEVEPQLTLRGHSAAITRLIHSPSKGLLYSASLDSSIRIWALPSPSHTTYAPYDDTRTRGELVGHTDAVWDLALVRDEGTLISCGAEGTVKVWDVSEPSGGGSLRLTWGWAGLEIPDDLNEDANAFGATAVEALKTDLKKVAVAYQNAIVKVFDIESGKEVSRLASNMTYDGTSATQINRIVSHPTMAILVTAHEDKFIRLFDITSGQCTHSMLAHLDGVTSLSIDSAGFSLVSGSHDCSIRFWDILGSRACLQEITTHREKGREGVLDVEFHPSLPFMASAGADGVVKLYASS